MASAASMSTASERPTPNPPHFSATSSTVPVLFGTCGWTDESLYKCGRFFPSSAKSATERLRHYSRHFPAVEIDTSNYAIPRQQQVSEWVGVVPPGFTFHIKAYGLFTMRSIAPGALPRDIRAEFVSPEQERQPALKLAEMSEAMVAALWARFNDAVGVLHEAGRLGVVVFQFQASFGPSVPHLGYIAECRRRLAPEFIMGVELRQRAWYSYSSTGGGGGGGGVAAHPESAYPPSTLLPPASHDGVKGPTHASQRAATLYFMRRLGLVNVSSDDLAEEYTPVDAAGQPVMRDGRLYIAEDVTSPLAAYVRLHRRTGSDRLLPADTVTDWVARLTRMTAAGGKQTTAGSPLAATPETGSGSVTSPVPLEGRDNARLFGAPVAAAIPPSSPPPPPHFPLGLWWRLPFPGRVSLSITPGFPLG